jgi:hypothetical protein
MVPPLLLQYYGTIRYPRLPPLLLQPALLALARWWRCWRAGALPAVMWCFCCLLLLLLPLQTQQRAMGWDALM